MTRKQLGEILVKQVVTIVTTLAIVLLTLALKAPFLFKQNMEREMDKKVDKAEVEKIKIKVDDKLKQKLNKEVFYQHLEQYDKDNKRLYRELDQIQEGQKEAKNLIMELMKMSENK